MVNVSTNINKTKNERPLRVISPLPAKAEGDYSFRFRPSVRPSH